MRSLPGSRRPPRNDLPQRVSPLRASFASHKMSARGTPGVLQRRLDERQDALANEWLMGIPSHSYTPGSLGEKLGRGIGGARSMAR